MGFISELSLWLQSWVPPDWGLLGVFVSAFLSATVLPGSSEVVLAALITAYPSQAWPGFGAALSGNVLGCVITFWMGTWSRKGYQRFQKYQINDQGPQVQRLRRWGPPAMVLAFLPLVGDALVLAAGWLRLPFWPCMAWVTLGKGARYLLLLAGMWGLLSL